MKLNAAFQLFSKCLIHIIVNHVDLLPNTTNLGGSWELPPINQPVVISKWSYFPNQTTKANSNPGRNIPTPPECVSLGLTRRKDKGGGGGGSFKFYASPKSIRVSCGAMVYIDSPVCNGRLENTSPPEFPYLACNEGRCDKLESGKLRITQGQVSMRSNTYIVHVSRRNRRQSLLEEDMGYFNAWLKEEENSTTPYPIHFSVFVTDPETVSSSSCWRCKVKSHYSLVLTSSPFTLLFKGMPSSVFGLGHVLLRYCSFLLRISYLLVKTFLDCSQRFKYLLQLGQTSFSIDSSGATSASAQELIHLGYQSCEDRSLLWFGLSKEELPPPAAVTSAKYIQSPEYLLDWRQETGSILHIFARVVLSNLSYIDDLVPTKSPESGNNLKFDFVFIMGSIKSKGSPSGLLQGLMTDQWSGIRSEFHFGSEHSQVHFVTCSRVQTRGVLSFLGYTSAFKLEVWVTLLGVTFLGAVVLLVVKTKGYSSTTSERRALAPRELLSHCLSGLACVYSILSGQGTHLFRKHRWYFGSWAIAGIVITNSYLGDNINRLTAPIPISRPDTFEDILSRQFPIHSPTIVANSYVNLVFNIVLSLFKQVYEVVPFLRMLQGTLGTTVTAAIFPGLANAQIEFCQKVNCTISEVLREMESTSLGNYSFKKMTIFNAVLQENSTLFRSAKAGKPVEILPETLHDAYLTSTLDYFVGKIGHCTDQAYVDVYSNVLKAKLQLLHLVNNGTLKKKAIRSEDIFMSREPLGQIYHNAVFINLWLPMDIVLRRIYALQQSGIDKLWENWNVRIRSWNATVMYSRSSTEGEFKPARMSNGNTVVIFYVHLILLSMAFGWFLFELRGKILQALARIGFLIWGVLVKLYSNLWKTKAVFRKMWRQIFTRPI